MSVMLRQINRVLGPLPTYDTLRIFERFSSVLFKGRRLHWGRFESQAAALASLKPNERLSYDNDAVVPFNLQSFSEVHLFDWPVLFALESMITEDALHSVTDYGGHVGVKYYAFKDHLRLPADIKWQVVDVPAMCREGRKRAAADAPALSFYERLSNAPPCDALLCSGVLQYVDLTLLDIVGQLPKNPRKIVLNKVPIGDGDGFYTLESFGIGKIPYRVLSQKDLDDARQALGYELLARWSIPHRDLNVRSSKGTDQVRMIGECWQLIG